MKNTFKTHTAIEKAVTKCTKEVTRKPVTFSFLWEVIIKNTIHIKTPPLEVLCHQ